MKCKGCFSRWTFCGVFLLMPLLVNGLYAQKEYLYHRSTADTFFMHKHYERALDEYNSALFFNPNDQQSLEGRAMSLYKTGDLRTADSALVHIFRTVEEPSPEMTRLRAMILHHRFEFDEAIASYKDFLRLIPKDHPDRQVIRNKIMRASTGLRIPGRRMDVMVENMGPDINTRGNEIRPLFSPNIPERIYFSSNRQGATGGMTDLMGVPDTVFGHYSSDMYMADLSGGEWVNIRHINQDLNSPIHDLALDFSNQGRVLYYFRGFSLEVGRVFTDTFGIERSEAGKLAPFDSPFVPELGDQGLTFVNDSTILFASNRPGGYGGFDIYMAMRRNGEWSEPLNLGPEVNSEYDELDPFMTAGGRELFFSSNRLSSIGKLDIFHAHWNPETRTWSWVENIGRPLNSAGNDRFFRISNDGNTSVFASDRPGGRGGYDLYLAYFRNAWEDQFESMDSMIVNSLFPLPVVPDFLQFDADWVLAFLEKMKEVPVGIPPVEDEPVEVPEEIPGEEEEKEEVVIEEAVKEEAEEKVEEVEEIEWVVEPFYYGSDGEILFEDNIKKADRLARILRAKPQVKLKLSGFSAGSSPLHLDLFFSINKAEAVANLLIDKGIEPERITVVGYGSQYPVALNHINREPYYAGQEANRRVVPALYKNGRKLEGVELRGKLEPEAYLSSRYRDFLADRSGVYFKVQISATRSMLNVDALNRYSHPKIERNMDSEFYRYSVGFNQTYDGIRDFRDQVRARGIDGAFIVPYLEGKRIQGELIRELSGIFEELKHLN